MGSPVHEKGVGQEKRGKRISNIEQGMSNEEGKRENDERGNHMGSPLRGHTQRI